MHFTYSQNPRNRSFTLKKMHRNKFQLNPKNSSSKLDLFHQSKIQLATCPIPLKPLDECLPLYFDRKLRVSFCNKIIDSYFLPKNPQNLQKQMHQKDKLGKKFKELRLSKSAQKTYIPKIREIKGIRLMGRRKTQGKYLPIIDEFSFQTQKLSQSKTQNQTTPQFGRTVIRDSSYLNSALDRDNELRQRLLLQNEHYYHVSIFQNDRIIREQKRFIQANDQILKRLQKAKLLGVPINYQEGCDEVTLNITPIQCLRESLYKLVEERHGDEKIFIIQPKQQYHLLYANECEKLFDLIRGVCKQLIGVRGKAINNRIHLNALRTVREKEYYMDWECSTILQNCKINQINVSIVHQPILTDSVGWLAMPEYLAPEILAHMVGGTMREVFEVDDSTKSDVWSLGCLVLEILTLIPLWMPYRCGVYDSNSLRRGLLGTARRNVKEIQNKLKNFRHLALKTIRTQIKGQVGNRLAELVLQMLWLNPQKRITPQGILETLGAKS